MPGRVMNHCKDCGGSRFCENGKRKTCCVDCSGGAWKAKGAL